MGSWELLGLRSWEINPLLGDVLLRRFLLYGGPATALGAGGRTRTEGRLLVSLGFFLRMDPADVECDRVRSLRLPFDEIDELVESVGEAGMGGGAAETTDCRNLLSNEDDLVGCWYLLSAILAGSTDIFDK